VAWKNQEVKRVIRQIWRRNEGNQRGWKHVLGKLDRSKKSILRWQKINRDPTEKELKETLETVQILQSGEGEWNMPVIEQLQIRA
jgi:hypothetical protein